MSRPGVEGLAARGSGNLDMGRVGGQQQQANGTHRSRAGPKASPPRQHSSSPHHNPLRAAATDHPTGSGSTSQQQGAGTAKHTPKHAPKEGPKEGGSGGAHGSGRKDHHAHHHHHGDRHHHSAHPKHRPSMAAASGAEEDVFGPAPSKRGSGAAGGLGSHGSGKLPPGSGTLPGPALPSAAPFKPPRFSSDRGNGARGSGAAANQQQRDGDRERDTPGGAAARHHVTPGSGSNKSAHQQLSRAGSDYPQHPNKAAARAAASALGYIPPPPRKAHASSEQVHGAGTAQQGSVAAGSGRSLQ